MLPLLVVRPEPGNAATVSAARGLGLQAIASPLFEVAPVTWRTPGAAPFDALLLASANAVRHGGDALVALTALPVYAVGPATAAAAREAGFNVVATGRGSLEALLPELVNDRRGRVLRLVGERHRDLPTPPGVELVTEVVYWAKPLSLQPSSVALLRGGAVIMLHSGEAARHFAAECARLDLARQRIALACLAPRVAEMAGAGWAARRSADRPDDPALLAMAVEMCQTRRGVAENSSG